MAAEPAMRPTGETVDAVLDRVTGPRRAEADDLLELLGEVSGEEPVVWAGRIVGFGEREYRYESGHGGREPLLAFATGSRQHTVYLANDFAGRWPELVERLGTPRTSTVCLYLTRLTGVDREALRELLRRTLDATGTDVTGETTGGSAA